MSECKWAGRDNPRLLHNRHENDCEVENCTGCLPCPKPHCIVCGIEHVLQRACPTCIGATRDDIEAIRSMYVDLPAQTTSGATYALDEGGTLEASRPIPGGEAMVMLSPGSHHGFPEYERDNEHMPTELLLATWEDDWREVRSGAHTLEPASMTDAVKYLDTYLDWAAQNHPAYDDFATEMRRHRAHLEDVLHAGEQVDTGAPCLVCGRALELIFGDEREDDRWWCSRCKGAGLKPEEYATNVARDSRRFAEWLTAGDMEAEHQIKRGTLQGWASKGKVRKRRDFHSGRMVYNVTEAKACRDREAEDHRDTA